MSNTNTDKSAKHIESAASLSATTAPDASVGETSTIHSERENTFEPGLSLLEEESK